MATAEERNLKEEKNKKEKEGCNLLGPPTFKELENGRFKCIETGHEVPAKDRESYGRSKGCRLGLIDAALSQKRPPLNTFKQDPLCRSKLICKLTGDTINKSEEHIWKHINGRRFLHKLEHQEMGKLTSNRAVIADNDRIKHKKSKPSVNGLRREGKGSVGKIESDASNHIGRDSDSEEPEIWIPPVGSRWDSDSGRDRWGSPSDLGDEVDEDEADEEIDVETGELSIRAKRMSIEVGPSSFASRKKKSKTDSADTK